MDYTIRQGRVDDLASLLSLYQAIAQQPGGIIRFPEEIHQPYIQAFLQASLDTGLSLVAETTDGQLIADIHAYSYGLQAFRHILGDLTIVVHPSAQGKGIGSRLFRQFLQIVEKDLPHILRIELLVREANQNAIQFYQKLGFKEEGRHHNRILNKDGSFETPIAMAWWRG